MPKLAPTFQCRVLKQAKKERVVPFSGNIRGSYFCNSEVMAGLKLMQWFFKNSALILC
jgi:hypothetical protein